MTTKTERWSLRGCREILDETGARVCAEVRSDEDGYRIAAVPELIEAAKAAIHGWETWLEMQPANDDLESLEWTEFDALRAVIRRAEGFKNV